MVCLECAEQIINEILFNIYVKESKYILKFIQLPKEMEIKKVYSMEYIEDDNIIRLNLFYENFVKNLYEKI